MSQKSPAKAPLHRWEQPEKNFDRVHIDYAGPKNGYFFLILVDAKSKWPEVRILSKAPTTESTITLLEDIFATHGYPKMMVSDNATIFTSDEFKKYCHTHGIFQSFTAPGHPATNGLAERYVQTIKSKISKMENSAAPVREVVKNILLQYRATPLQCGQSPAELYLNRQLRIRLDAILPFKPPANPPTAARICEIAEGQRVQAQTFYNNAPTWSFGKIVKRLGRLHYQVRLDNGYVFKRHIDQLRASTVPEPVIVGEKPSTPTREEEISFVQFRADRTYYSPTRWRLIEIKIQQLTSIHRDAGQLRKMVQIIAGEVTRTRVTRQ